MAFTLNIAYNTNFELLNLHLLASKSKELIDNVPFKSIITSLTPQSPFIFNPRYIHLGGLGPNPLFQESFNRTLAEFKLKGYDSVSDFRADHFHELCITS